jgi:hypothetical protein
MARTGLSARLMNPRMQHNGVRVTRVNGCIPRADSPVALECHPARPTLACASRFM